MSIIVNVALATICFSNNCYPVLLGKDTPIGHFSLINRITEQDGYGGDVLQFKETDNSWYAIHRLWLLNPKEHRLERIQSTNVKDRVTITHGCINVMPEVYEELKQCCSKDTLIIER